METKTTTMQVLTLFINHVQLPSALYSWTLPRIGVYSTGIWSFANGLRSPLVSDLILDNDFHFSWKYFWPKALESIFSSRLSTGAGVWDRGTGLSWT